MDIHRYCCMTFLVKYKETLLYPRHTRYWQGQNEGFHPSPTWWTNEFTELLTGEWPTSQASTPPQIHTLVSWLPLISPCWGVSCEPPTHKRMLIGLVLWESLVCRHSSFVYKWQSSCPIQRKQLCYHANAQVFLLCDRDVLGGSGHPLKAINHPDFHTHILFFFFFTIL